MGFQKICKGIAISALAFAAMITPATGIAQQGTDTVLKPADTAKLLPASVYFRGQSATTQIRNSGGVKFADGFYLLATLVDTSGYSTDLQSKYQAYFITEVPIKIGGQNLPAGVYGIGFLSGDKLVIMDVGAHDLFTIASANDPGLKRPMPLQIVADPAGGYRLYALRSYVNFSR